MRAALDTYGVPHTYFADQKLKDGNLRSSATSSSSRMSAAQRSHR